MNKVRELSVKYQVYDFFQILMVHYLNQVDASVLLTDKINIRRDISPDMNWCFSRSENTNMWPLRYNLTNKNKIISDFFTNTPEQILSFLRIPALQQLMQNKFSGKISLNSSKTKLYQQAGFDQLGFYNKTYTIERIAKLDNKANDIIDEELKFRPRNMYIEYQHLVDSLTNGGITCQYI